MKTYIVICQSVVGSGRRFEVVYDSDVLEFSDIESAIRHGFTVRDSDDFNIGVVDGGALVGFQWMEHPCEGHNLAYIAESIGLSYAAPERAAQGEKEGTK